MPKTPFRVRSSAPGKCILMGEHAAVYGRPALVAAVGLRLEVELTERDDREVRLDLGPIGVRQSLSWPEVVAYARGSREAWEAYCEDPDPVRFARVRGSDPAHLAKVALGEACLFLGETEGPGLEVRVSSQIPLGSGFGSSAAASLALVAAYLKARLAQPSQEQLFELALEAERRQHGMPSGVDTAAVLRGGVLQVERGGTGSLEFRTLEAKPELLAAFGAVHTGTPEQSTGEVVAAVRSRRERDRQVVDSLLDRLQSATEAMARNLVSEQGSVTDLLPIVREAHRCLQGLGVVPPRLSALVREVESAGGAAKISGAGALTDPGAGSLLLLHPQVEGMMPVLAGLPRVGLDLGAPGLSVSRVQ